jgi:hypothetical protein
MAKEKSQRGVARGKLRAHFLTNIGRVMDSDELLAVVDGQSECLRRVRELRNGELLASIADDLGYILQ